MSHVDYSGKTLEGRYQVVRLLGRGGMGSVYEGRHVVVGKRVAIKFLHAEFAQNEEVLKRFYREAQAAAAIGHKNIIDIMDVGVSAENEPYIVMEYLEGEDLEGMLKRTGALSVETACGILEPALLALAAAHSKGIVHRDLKPANIFLVRNEGAAPTVKLIDFGISKFTGGNKESRLTRTGSLLGTPAYMAPEQARGVGDIDHRADVYSMGVILYEMLTGALPFEGENYNTLLINMLTTEARRPREVNPSIPVDAELVVLRELSKDPGGRSQGALQMLESLKELSAFAERASGMSLIGTKIKRGFAGGDLGSVIGTPGSGSSASRVLSEMAHKGTPGAWGGTAAKGGPSKGLVIGLGAVALVIIAGVVFALTRGEPSPVFVPVTAPITASPPVLVQPDLDEGVLVTVEGAPAGATIIFDGAPVPMNPFRVKKATTLAQLKVEALGFESFATSIVPEKDVIVAVKMKTLAPTEEPSAAQDLAAKTGEGGGKAKKKTKGAEPAADTSAKAADKKLSEGRRGAIISEDFD